MRLLNTRVHWFVGLMLATAVLSAGCNRGPYLWVKQSRYQPRLSQYVTKSYRGRAIHLMDFVNRTSSKYYFYSPNRAVTYEASPSIEGYFKACFGKALTFSGMRLMPQATTNVPSLRLVLHRLTDQQLVFDAFLYLNRRTIFRKRYTVTRGPLRSHQKQHLEQMAFYQMNLAVTKLFQDRQFWAAFFQVRQPAGTPTPSPATPTPTPSPATPPPSSPGSTPPPAPGNTPPSGTTTPPPAP